MLDLRKDKSNGFLSKSHLVNGDWRRTIDNFIEMRGKYHFVLMCEEGKEDFTEIIGEFLNKGFNFVSIVIGGFSGLHLFHQIFDFQILDHEKQKCSYCSNRPPLTPSVGSGFISQFIQNVFKKSTTDPSKVEKPLKKPTLKDFARKSPQKKNMSPIKHLKKNPPSPSRSPSSPPVLSTYPLPSSPLVSSSSLPPASFIPISSSSLSPLLNPSSLPHPPSSLSSSSNLLPPSPATFLYPSTSSPPSSSLLHSPFSFPLPPLPPLPPSSLPPPSFPPPPFAFPPPPSFSSSSSSSSSSLSHLIQVDYIKKQGKTNSMPLQENYIRDNSTCFSEKGSKNIIPNIIVNDHGKNNKDKENHLKIDKNPKNERKTVFNINPISKEQKEKNVPNMNTKELKDKNILNNENKEQKNKLIFHNINKGEREQKDLNIKNESEQIKVLNNFEEKEKISLNLNKKEKHIKNSNKNEEKNQKFPKSKVAIQDLTVFLSQFEFFCFVGEEIVENGDKEKEKENQGTNYKMKETIIVVSEGK